MTCVLVVFLSEWNSERWGRRVLPIMISID
jgi:hypothetical protein